MTSGSGWPPERRQAAALHSLVNGLGVLSLAAMHLWGELDALPAAGAILALCGLWVRSTSGGPPTAGPGGSGALAALLGSLGHALGKARGHW